MQDQSPIYFNGFINEKKQNFNLMIDEANDSTFDDILPLYIEQNFSLKRLKWDDFCGDIELNSLFSAHTFWNIQYTYEPVSDRCPTQVRQLVHKRSESPSYFIVGQIGASQKNDRVQRTKLPPVGPINNVFFRPPVKNPMNEINLNNQGKNPSPRNSYFPSPRQNCPLDRLNPRFQSPTPQHRSYSQQQINKDIIVINPDIKIEVRIRCYLNKRSWVRHQSQLLLEHERGHYLLGSLCALEFKKQAESICWEETEKSETLKTQVTLLFAKILNQFLEIEKQYDIQTSHFLNQQSQMQWNRKIKEQLKLYENYFTR